MNNQRKKYSGKDLAFIVPTKDRPQKIRKLLSSVAKQTESCGRVIIVDGGKSVKGVVMEFAGSIPVEYHECNPPGQIRQRNMGIDLLNERNLLVGFLDDDIVLEPDALKQMINFWNNTSQNIAGVGFNNISSSVSEYTNIFSRLSSNYRVPGRVLSSGINTSIENILSDIQTQWLGGGYTVWKHSILKEFPHDDIRTRWAAAEDLRFSYPIGKIYPLYVCSKAKVRHEHTYDQAPEQFVYTYQGRKHSLEIFYFVGLHKELSKIMCLLVLLRSGIANFFLGCVTLNSKKIRFSLGRAQGILICLKSMLGSLDLRRELED